MMLMSKLRVAALCSVLLLGVSDGKKVPKKTNAAPVYVRQIATKPAFMAALKMGVNKQYWQKKVNPSGLYEPPHVIQEVSTKTMDSGVYFKMVYTVRQPSSKVDQAVCKIRFGILRLQYNVDVQELICTAVSGNRQDPKNPIKILH